MLAETPRMVSRAVALAIAIGAFAVGTISLWGWLSGEPRFTDWDMDGIAMLANASLAAAAAGIALGLLVLSPPARPDRLRWAVRAFALVCATLGGLTLTQHLFGWDLGIDTMLVDPRWGERAAAAPGRMGPPASTSFFLIGCAMFLAASRVDGARRRVSVVLATVAALPSIVASTAYIYGVDPLYSLPHITGIARQTATVILGLSIGSVLAVHEYGLAAVLRRDDAAGILVRRLLPIGVILLVLTGWMEDYGLKQGLYTSNFGNAALTALRIVMFLLVLWWTARAVIQQIERRDRAETALRESEAKLSGLIEHLPVGVGVTDPDGKALSLNPAGLRLHGFSSPEEMLVNLEDYQEAFELRYLDGRIVPDTDWPLARSIRGDYVTDLEVELRRRGDSRAKLVSFSAVPILDDEADFATSVVFVMHDITARKRAEQALAESEEFSRSVLESSPECIQLLDLDGTLVYMNASGLELAEIEDFERFRSCLWAEFWGERLRPTAEAAIQEALEGGVGTFRGFCKTAKGNSKHWDVMVTPVPDSKGKPIRLLAVSRETTELKRVEQALRESEQRFRTMADNISQFAWMADENGWIFWYNQRWYDYTGTTLQEMQGWGWKKVHHPDHLDRVVERIQHSWDTGEIWEDLFPLRGKDGNYRWFLSRALPIRDDDGNVVRWFGTHTDVTETRAAEEALRESEERVRMAVQAADVGTWDYNLVTGALEWSERCKAVFGLPPDADVDYDVFLEVLHPDDRDRVNRMVEAALAPEGDGSYECEYRALWPDGTVRWIAAKGKTLFDEGGGDRRAVRMMGTVVDLTERKQFEMRLTEEVATTEALRRIGSLLAAELDQEKLVQAVTDVATTLTEAEFGAFFYNVTGEQGDLYTLYTVSGAPKELFDQLPMPRRTAIFDPKFQGTATVRLDDVTQDARYGKNPPHYGMPEGHLPVKAYLAVPVMSRSGEVLGALFFGHSRAGVFTERHQHLAEGIAAQAAVALDNARLYRMAQQQTKQLRQSDQRKDEFLATLAHELRNPLAAIRTASMVLDASQNNREQFDEMMGVLERQTLLLVRLIDDLLDVSRITRGKIQLKRERVELAAVIRQAVETCRPVAERDQQKIDVELPDEAVVLDGDAVRLAQIFGNLLNNACKYSSRDAVIRLRAEVIGSEVLVSVKDPGIGIPQDELESIFEMFSQADAGLERARGGLGIGLTLVKRLVELHGGSASARSDGPGRGSEFIVTLPLSDAASDDVDTTSDPHAASTVTRRRILVVDDNEDAARSLAISLQLSGCETRTAFDGESAIREVGAFEPDVVLLDLGMPGMSGYEICEAIRATPRGARLAVVAVTGWGQDDVRRRSLAAGFDDHLVKPISLPTLSRVLDDISTARQTSV